MQSIGERLEEARKRKGISIREAAESTKIRGDYLHKFESNQYDLHLPEIYVRGFLRSYASFLKLPSDKIIADYNALTHLDPKSSPRTVNRDVYGRMDISTTKEPKPHNPDSPVGTGGTGGTTTPPMLVENGAAPATPSATAPRNPVTFVPPAHSTGSPIDKKLLVKAIVLGVVALLVVIFVVAILFKSGNGGATNTANTAAARGQPGANPANTAASLLPQPGERTFDIVAKNGPVAVEVQNADTTVFYQGTIQPGDRRTLPRRVGMLIRANPYGNVELVFDGVTWPITGPQTIRTAQ